MVVQTPGSPPIQIGPAHSVSPGALFASGQAPIVLLVTSVGISSLLITRV